MEKTIYIDEKPVRLRSTAALTKRYKAQFRRDYFADLMKIAKTLGATGKKKLDLSAITYEDLGHLDMEIFYDIVWTMAKSADKSIPDPEEWLDGFEKFPIWEILGEVGDMLVDTMPSSKKK